MAKKFPPESKEAIEISEKANVKINDQQLEQIFLHASKSLAYQHLINFKSAEKSIKLKSAEKSIRKSMKFLKVWGHDRDKTKTIKLKNEFLQTKIFALSVQGNLLKKQNDTQKARAAYQEAFDILQESKINPFKDEFSILDKNTVVSVHRELIYLLSTNNNQENTQIDEVKASLKKYWGGRRGPIFAPVRHPAGLAPASGRSSAGGSR